MVQSEGSSAARKSEARSQDSAEGPAGIPRIPIAIRSQRARRHPALDPTHQPLGRVVRRPARAHANPWRISSLRGAKGEVELKVAALRRSPRPAAVKFDEPTSAAVHSSLSSTIALACSRRDSLSCDCANATKSIAIRSVAHLRIDCGARMTVRPPTSSTGTTKVARTGPRRFISLVSRAVASSPSASKKGETTVA